MAVSTDPTDLELIEEFDHAAQGYGIALDRGFGAAVTSAEKAYTEAREALKTRLRELRKAAKNDV